VESSSQIITTSIPSCRPTNRVRSTEGSTREMLVFIENKSLSAVKGDFEVETENVNKQPSYAHRFDF